MAFPIKSWRKRTWIAVAVCSALQCQAVIAAAFAPPGVCLSPAALVGARGGKTMLIAGQTATMPTGRTASVLSPDGEMLYACNRFSHNVSVVDLVLCQILALLA